MQFAHLRKDTVELEKLQKGASKMILELEQVTYEEKLQHLGFFSLEGRKASKQAGDVIDAYTIMYGVANNTTIQRHPMN